jgi:hypothetical protein
MVDAEQEDVDRLVGQGVLQCRARLSDGRLLLASAALAHLADGAAGPAEGEARRCEGHNQDADAENSEGQAMAEG